MTKGEQQPRKKPNDKKALEKIESLTEDELEQVYGGQEQAVKNTHEEASKRAF